MTMIRKIIISIVLVALLVAGLYIYKYSDGFSNFGKFFDNIYDKVDKNIETTAVSDTTNKDNKYIFYNENRTLFDDKTYISYRHKYSQDFNDLSTDSLYYLYIDARLTTNGEFVDFSVYYGEETFDNGMKIEITKINNDFEKYRCNFGFGEYIYTPTSNKEYEYEYIQDFDISVGEYFFYLVFDSKQEKIILCHYDYLSTLRPNVDYFEQALKFPILIIDKNDDATSNAYECLSNLFDNRETPFLYRSGILSQNENIYNDVFVKEYYKSSKFLDLEPRPGYTFKGFFYDEEFRQPYDGIPVKPVEQLFQKWEINKYNVIFDSRIEEDSNIDLVEKIYTHGDQLDYIPVREGYDFVCWINDATNKEYVIGPVTENLYLRAKWETHKLKVTYLDEDESFLYEQFIEIGGFATYVPKKVGYKFVGWKNFNDTPIFDEETTLTATWLAAECKVTLYINNNIYKAYQVGYGQSLNDFLKDIGISEKYISKYAYSDLTGSNIAIDEILLEKDIRIDISDSYIRNKEFISSLNENRTLIVTCGGVFIGFIVIFFITSIFGKKKRKKAKYAKRK